MAQTTELERLVVKVLADASNYAKVMKTVPLQAKIAAKNVAFGFKRGFANDMRPLIGLAANTGKRIGIAVQNAMTLPLQAKIAGKNMVFGFQRGLAGNVKPLTGWAAKTGRAIGSTILSAMNMPLRAKIGAKAFAWGMQKGWAGSNIQARGFAAQFGKMVGGAPNALQWGARQGISNLVMGSARAAKTFTVGIAKGIPGAMRALPGQVSRLARGFSRAAAHGIMGWGVPRGRMGPVGLGVHTPLNQLAYLAGHGARQAGMGFVGGAMGGARAVGAAGRGAMGLARGAMGIGGGLLRGAGAGAAGIAGGFEAAFGAVRRAAVKTVQFVENHFRRLGYDISYLGRQITFYLALPILGFGTAAVKSFADFDDAMTTSIAVMGGVSEATRKALEDMAGGIAARSRTSPTEVATAYFHLASAGYKAADALGAVGVVEKFATAGAFDLEGRTVGLSKATSFLVDSLAALGLHTEDAAKNMEHMKHVGDVLTKANIISNATVQDFAKALTNKGAAAMRLLNKDIEEGVAVLAAFAAQGVKGEAAGEKLYIITRDLARAVIKHRDEWTALGISVFDTTGKMRPLADVIANMEKVLNPMSDELKRSTLMTLGLQDRSLAAMIQMLGMSEAVRKFEAQLRSADGAMDAVVDMRLKSFTSQMLMLKNQLISAGINIGRLFVPMLTSLNEKIKEGLVYWNSLSPAVQKWTVAAVMAAAVTGPVIVAFGLLLSAISVAMRTFETFGLMISGVVFGPIKLVAGAVFSLIRVFFKLAAAIVFTAARLTVDLAAALTRVLISTVSTAITSVMGLINFVTTLTAVAGPLGLLAAVLGLIAGFATTVYIAFGFISAQVLIVAKVATAAGAALMGIGTSLLSSLKSVGVFLMNIRGPKGLSGALEAATTSAKDFSINAIRALKEFGLYAVGFMENYSQNMEILWKWLEDNWDQIYKSIAEGGQKVFENLSHNAKVAVTMMSEMMKHFTGWLGRRFKNLWIDFKNAARLAFLETLVLALDWAEMTLRIMAGGLKGHEKELAKLLIALTTPDAHVMEENIGHMLKWTFGKFQNQFKGIFEGVEIPNIKPPEFIVDIKEKAEEALGPVEELGTAVNAVAEKLEEPIEAKVAIKGIEAVEARSAKFFRQFMEYKSMMAATVDVAPKSSQERLAGLRSARTSLMEGRRADAVAAPVSGPRAKELARRERMRAHFSKNLDHVRDARILGMGPEPEHPFVTAEREKDLEAVAAADTKPKDEKTDPLLEAIEALTTAVVENTVATEEAGSLISFEDVGLSTGGG